MGENLNLKLKSYLRPKCHPIFYDSNINSPGVVRLNIYQVFLLCAMKFICQLSNLSILPKFYPKFCLKAIETSLRYVCIYEKSDTILQQSTRCVYHMSYKFVSRYMNRLIKRRIYSFKGDGSFRPKYEVKKKDVLWLGLYAYSRVLLKKHLKYKHLLRLFRFKLKAYGYGEVENMPPELQYAVDDVHSSVLWNIKY